MAVIEQVFRLKTSKRCEMIDITSEIQDYVRKAEIVDGEVIVFCPHTTAAITINENADPDVQHDMLMTLEELIPQNRQGYRHMEGNSDAHVKSSLFGCSQQILVKDRSLVLGTWQGIYFCEFDGPRTRKILLHIRHSN